MLGIVKTSSQNLRSIINCLDFLNIKSNIIDDIDQINDYEKIILPGVGSFDPVVKSIKKIGINSDIIKNILNKKKVLAICIGLQLLCKNSEEGAEPGLGIIKSKVMHLKNLECKLPIPHVGFNNVLLKKNDSDLDYILKNKFYFTHSYGVDLTNFNLKDFDNYGVTNYGKSSFVSLIKYNKSIATQFHPEKSGKAGLNLIKYFYDQ
tara:strand:+ start:441 stop:1058 length:618 start_codon:yes stop_codon:yes gene_type:complete